MQRTRICAVGLGLALLAGCGEGPTSPSITRSGSGGGTSLNLTGAWSGSANDTLGAFRMAWQLAQSNRNVTGTVTGTTPVGAPLYSSGTFSGTLSGNALTFTIAIPRGAVVDAPDCSVTLSGTAPDVTGTGLTATYTGNDSCLGAILDGRVTMVKQ